jgi:hypothetical protein
MATSWLRLCAHDTGRVPRGAYRPGQRGAVAVAQSAERRGRDALKRRQHHVGRQCQAAHAERGCRAAGHGAARDGACSLNSQRLNWSTRRNWWTGGTSAPLNVVASRESCSRNHRCLKIALSPGAMMRVLLPTPLAARASSHAAHTRLRVTAVRTASPVHFRVDGSVALRVAASRAGGRRHVWADVSFPLY